MTAEIQRHARPEPRVWFNAGRTARQSPESSPTFDSGRLAPVDRAAIWLPAANMTLVVALDTRADARHPWQRRWQGPIDSFAATAKSGATAIRFAATRDRHWRIRVVRGGDSLAGRALNLRLGYQPARLRFVAQGQGPFTLAFGSAVAKPRARGCHDLAGNDPAGTGNTPSRHNAHRTMIGSAKVDGAAFQLAGEKALAPLPAPQPVGRYVLWAVLIAGAGLVIVLAIRLLRKIS